MKKLADFLPLLDLRGADLGSLGRDAGSAVALTFLAVPQSVAYAIIAGLPPAMGLYAACLPAIIGGLFRSSQHVVTGPTNALSLLVGSVLAAQAGLDPINTAMLLALLVGGLQLVAGLLRFGVLIEYISMPVVTGYITGAGVLIGVGQLHNLTATASGSGNIFTTVGGWAVGLGAASWLAIAFGVGTAAMILGVRWLGRRLRRSLPSALIALIVATVAGMALDLDLRRVADLTSGPVGFPPIGIPSLEGWDHLLPLAVAVAVLSLVESTALARALAAKSGQSINTSVEFSGQGLANIVAGLTGGYPTSGSLSRSALNLESGASRLGGVLSGVLIILALLFVGPAIEVVPIASLAGLLLIVAADLVDVPRIRQIIASRRSDATAFVATVLATWMLRLDHAIYAGVGISLFFYLRRARLLGIKRIGILATGEITEKPAQADTSCPAMTFLQVDGQLFFGAAGELQEALDEAAADESLQILVLRMRRALHLDVTIARVLADTAKRLRDRGKRLVLVGISPRTREVLIGAGAVEDIGDANLFARSDTVFRGLQGAVVALHAELPPHDCGLPIAGASPGDFEVDDDDDEDEEGV